MENVAKRNLRTQMGEHYLGWANDYFSDTSRLNSEIVRKEFVDHCKSSLPKSIIEKWSPQKYREKLSHYCLYRGFKLNPLDKCTEKDTRRIAKGGTEYFYIETSSEPNIINENNDMPF